MEDNSKLRNPGVQESALPLMPNPTQQPAPPYVQGVVAPVHHQTYHPNQYAPVPQQPMVYQPAQHVVTGGPLPPMVGAPLQPIYSDYLYWSIVNILFCCLPLGIAALIFSVKTNHAKARNDQHSTKSHSSTARALNISSCCYISIIVVITHTAIYRIFHNYFRY